MFLRAINANDFCIFLFGSTVPRWRSVSYEPDHQLLSVRSSTAIVLLQLSLYANKNSVIKNGCQSFKITEKCLLITKCLPIKSMKCLLLVYCRPGCSLYAAPVYLRYKIIRDGYQASKNNKKTKNFILKCCREPYLKITSYQRQEK